jgi:putative tricarboxylic transport membrane protein
MTFILLGLTALVVGIITGLLPGVSLTTVLIIFYSLAVTSDAQTIFYLFLILIVTIQYYGGISSVVFGVMGEITEQPTVDNGHELFRRGHGNVILPAMATHSVVSGLLSILVLSIIVFNSTYLIFFLSSTAKVLMLFTALLLLFFTSKNKTLTLVLIVCGLFLGIIGSSVVPIATNLVAKYSIFSFGIPFIPLRKMMWQYLICTRSQLQHDAVIYYV